MAKDKKRSELDDAEEMIQAVTIANRINGSVNAPSLMQRVIPYCLDIPTNVEAYKRNRNLLYRILIENGFECVKPQGAFYLFVKTPINDREFCRIAKRYNLLFVPGSSFGCAGYVRIAYCVAYDMIERSQKAFEKLGKVFFSERKITFRVNTLKTNVKKVEEILDEK